MANGERSGSGGRRDWAVILGGMVGGAAGGAVALLWRPAFFSGGLLLGTIGFCLFLVVGGVLGQLAGRLLFRPSPGGALEDKKGSS